MKPLYLAIGVLAASLLSVLSAQAFDDPFNDYLQRSDTILLGAGNASDTNAAIHTITPWPPNAFHTRIPAEGRNAVDSVERMYRTPNPFDRQGSGARAGAPGPAGEPGTGIGIGIGNASPTPVQPLQGGY
jgi:hypothetical protein